MRILNGVNGFLTAHLCNYLQCTAMLRSTSYLMRALDNESAEEHDC